MKKILLVLCVCIFGLSGCSNDELTIENKIKAEIEYVEKNCSIFVKKFNDNEYIKDGVLDTEKINYDAEVFVKSLSVIEDDLKYVKLDEKILNNIAIIIQNMNNYYQNGEYDNLKNEYVNLYYVFESLEK